MRIADVTFQSVCWEKKFDTYHLKTRERLKPVLHNVLVKRNDKNLLKGESLANFSVVLKSIFLWGTGSFYNFKITLRKPDWFSMIFHKSRKTCACHTCFSTSSQKTQTDTCLCNQNCIAFDMTVPKIFIIIHKKR